MTNSFGNRNFMQPMEGPRVHSRCLAFIPEKENPNTWVATKY
jgi:hypothetical protein